jgi:hypothetical protein
VKLRVLPSLRAAADTAPVGSAARQLLLNFASAPAYGQTVLAAWSTSRPAWTGSPPLLIMQGTADPLISMQFPRFLAFIPRAQFRWLHGFSRCALRDNVRAHSVLCRQ